MASAAGRRAGVDDGLDLGHGVVELVVHHHVGAELAGRPASSSALASRWATCSGGSPRPAQALLLGLAGDGRHEEDQQGVG